VSFADRTDIPGEREIPKESRFSQLMERNKKGLFIGSIAQEYKRKFIEWGDKEFAGDHGKLLQHLMDTYYSRDKHNETSQKIEVIMSVIEDITTQLNEIEKKIQNLTNDFHASRQKHKMMSGRVI